MSLLSRFNRNLVAASHDAFMAAASFLVALYLRLGPDELYLAKDSFVSGTVLFTLVCVAVFSYMRLNRGLWQYASMRDIATILKSVTLAVIVFAALMFIIDRLHTVPRSVFFINWMLLLFMLAGPRFIYRALKDRTFSWQSEAHEWVKIPVLLIGANDQAERFIRDMTRDSRALYEAVGIADADPARRNRTIHNVPILGGSDALAAIIHKLERKGKRPQKLILADERMTGEQIRQVLESSDGLGIPLARLPKPSEIKTGVTDRLDIQPIAVEDLLGRAQNVIDREGMKRLVSGKRVLITGAGGTIGGELARQIASYGPNSLIVVENSEFNLYQIEREIRGSFPELPLVALIADVRDETHIQRIFAQNKPDLVFHAAAIKHVPISENNAEETVLTNVLGTRNVAQACLGHGAEIMVMISTDKAVNPTNVMGASKRLAESICQMLGSSVAGKTRFMTVRFGNVLGSTGSVVPLFTEQLAKGGPITVTHPEMTRYFMTVREAVELVLQAATIGAAMQDRKECIFVLDMGQPVKINDLAQQMIRLAGLKPGEDIKIIYTGLRPGEKLYEELFHFSENAVKTTHEGIFLASPRTSDAEALSQGIKRLIASCLERKEQEVRAILKELVPEYESGHKR